MEKKVLAIVAGREITNEDVENVINGYAPEESKKMQNETVRRKILEQLVATRLFSMQAREEKLDETKEFNDLLEKLKDEVLGQMQKGFGIFRIVDVNRDYELIDDARAAALDIIHHDKNTAVALMKRWYPSFKV